MDKDLETLWGLRCLPITKPSKWQSCWRRRTAGASTGRERSWSHLVLPLKPNVFQALHNTNSLQNIRVEEPRLFCHQRESDLRLALNQAFTKVSGGWRSIGIMGPVDIVGRNISSSQHTFEDDLPFSRLVGYEFLGGIFTCCTYCCWQTSSDRKPRLIGLSRGFYYTVKYRDNDNKNKPS